MIKNYKKPEESSKSTMLHVRLSNNLLTALKEKSEKSDITLSQMIRMVLQRAADPKTKINLGVDFK